MRYALFVLPWAWMPASLGRAAEAAPVAFESHIRPILKAHCFECHGEGKRLRAGLDVRLRRSLVEGGDSGQGLMPGQPQASLILERVRSGAMPPGKVKLKPHEIALLERWIAQGASTLRPEPTALPLGFSITAEEAAHWSFQPIRRPVPPAVKNTQSIRTPIDAFLLAKLEERGLAFSPEADPATLLRRLHFDLTGMPPSAADVDAFVAECQAGGWTPEQGVPPAAWEKAIDRLLASPHYGERWGRHWLDVAGYADSEGYSSDDRVRDSAWRYRDYVIRAFNADMPLDRFIQEQLAGDEMVRPPYEQLAPQELDKLIATGFLRMAPDGTGSPGVDVAVASNQTIADTLQIVSSSLLGLTMHCAQCHNHRYDPIPQTDYFKLRAVFEPALNWKKWLPPTAREVPILTAADRDKAAAVEAEAAKIDQLRLKKQAEFIEQTFEKELAKLPTDLHQAVRSARATSAAQRTPEQTKLLQSHPSVNVSAGSLYLYDAKAAATLKEFADKASKLRAAKPKPEYLRALTEMGGHVPTTQRFERGDHEQPKEAIAPAHLSILEAFALPAIPDNEPGLPSTGRRLAFARSLTSGQHPLPARVLVNRVWQNHFGRGIVATPGDFGLLGERPSHPDLLDWLASELQDPRRPDGAPDFDARWRLKRIHKLIVMSTAYRQASARRPDLEKIDPDNRLLGRMPLRRLEAEAIRDAILKVSGRLNPAPFGPPVPVTVDDVGQVVVGKDNRRSDGVPDGTIKSLGGEENRRSVYVQVRRSLPLAMLETFDAPTITPNCEVRNASTVAPQALMLMNSRFALEQARFFAERLQHDAGANVSAQVALAWKIAYGASATNEEIERATRFVKQHAATLSAQGLAGADEAALASYCQALLSSNRFLYVD